MTISKKKIWMAIIILIVNAIVITSLFLLSKKIRNDEKLKYNQLEIPAHGGDFLF